jgi:hypothetical protein
MGGKYVSDRRDPFWDAAADGSVGRSLYFNRFGVVYGVQLIFMGANVIKIYINKDATIIITQWYSSSAFTGGIGVSSTKWTL